MKSLRTENQGLWTDTIFKVKQKNVVAVVVDDDDDDDDDVACNIQNLIITAAHYTVHSFPVHLHYDGEINKYYRQELMSARTFVAGNTRTSN